jgi:anti-sigma factor RsiW
MPCPETETRLQAFFDGELDPLAAGEVERHLESCAECGALLAELQELRTALRDLPYAHAPAALKARIGAALDAESAATAAAARTAPAASVRPAARTRARPFAFWWGAVSGAAVAAGAAFLWVLPAAQEPLLGDLVNAHVRSLMPDHLIDVESTDRHTVKPWFAGHADVSPAVVDFAEQGYRLIGGRADYFERQRAAVVVYRHGAHVINVFTWSSGPAGLPGDSTRNGYHLAFWRAGNLDYCAVSDAGWEELRTLEKLLKGVDAAPPRTSME